MAASEWYETLGTPLRRTALRIQAGLRTPVHPRIGRRNLVARAEFAQLTTDRL